MAQTVLVICGPTASGKSALAVELALRYNGEVISADSMQLYRGMDVGTAKPTSEEMRGVPHHMLDIADPSEDYSAARYVQDATACVEDVLSRQKLPIIAGGTGLYIDSLLSGRDFAPFSGAHRVALQERVTQTGLAPLYAELGQVDPERAQRVHPNDEKRILRALEVFYETGETITAHDRRTQSLPPRYHALRLGLTFRERDDLWTRIDARVDQMLALGLEAEVRALLDSGTLPTSTAMQAIGYKEMAAMLRQGRPANQAAGEIKLRSRQYAKRQLTWFRRAPDVHWLHLEKTPNFSVTRQDATAYLEEFGIR